MKPEEKKRDETGTDSGLGSSLGPQPNPEFVAQGMSFEDLKNCQSSENLPNDGFQLVSRKKKKKKPSRNCIMQSTEVVEENDAGCSYKKNKLEDELKDAQRIAIDDCIDKEQNIRDLMKQIDDCDGVLENLEGMLSCFLNELGSISFEMIHLKEQSVVINQQLHNRQKVRGELSQFVDDMVVPHSMIKIILEKDAGSGEFIEQLHELQHKLNFVRAQQFQDAKSVEDVHDVIENLKSKAMEKIRAWLLLKIEMFKKPFTNYQITQNTLLRSRFFYEFLLANDRSVASEIKEEYIDIVGKMLFSYFKEYTSRLFKLQMSDSASKTDLLGAEDSLINPIYAHLNLNLFNLKTQHTRTRATVYSLGNRINLLTEDLMSALIVPHISQESNETFQFENIFRSIQYAIIDHCSHEYLFICDFFIATEQLAIELFNKVMGRCIAHLLKILEEKIAFNYDGISMYICICLCKKYTEILKERKIPAVDSYFDVLSRLLWSRMETVMNLHTESLHNFGSKSNSAPSLGPHYVIRRYAELATSFHACIELVFKEHGDNRLQSFLARQQSEVENLINRLATQLNTRKDQLTFQINNYDVILSVMNEKVMAETKEKVAFQELLGNKKSAFATELIRAHFSSTIQFISECESLIEQNNNQMLSKFTMKASHVVKTFNGEWKRSVSSIRDEIMHSFTNFKNGATVLNETLDDLIKLHNKLSHILSHDSLSVQDNLVSSQEMEEAINAYQQKF